MKIFDGIKGVSVIYVCYGLTYVMAEYGIVQNPQYIDSTKQKFWFTFVTGGFFAVSILFFVSGFLLTFSLLNVEEPMSGKEVGLYYAKRLFKLLPFNVFALMFAMYFAPQLGDGPYYAKIEQALEPCKTYWWTNVLYINNFYPANYADKCMPQTWFLACFVQMSLIVPIIVAAFLKSSTASRIICGLLFVVCFGVNFGLAYTKNQGMYPFVWGDKMWNTDFYNDQFMMPYYQLPTFLVGVSFALVYCKYLRLREDGNEQRSFSMMFFNSLIVKRGARYAMYVAGIVFFCLVFFGVWGYNAHPDQYALWVQSMFAATGHQVLVLSVACFVMPALIGRAELIRFICAGSFWQTFAFLSLGIVLFFPIECLTYYFGIQ